METQVQQNRSPGRVPACYRRRLASSNASVHVRDGLVIYNKRLDHGSMHLVERIREGDPSMTPFEWHRLADTIQGIIDDPRRRLQRLKALRDAQMETSLRQETSV